jgi:HTH-type transcriptional regulator, competence development regulator
MKSALGLALRTLREARGLALREVATLAAVDHAYIYRLETGEKEAPSVEVIEKLVKVLRPSKRDQAIVQHLGQVKDVDPDLVAYVLATTDVEFDEYATAAGTRLRGARPEPAVLIARARRMLAEDDSDG